MFECGEMTGLAYGMDMVIHMPILRIVINTRFMRLGLAWAMQIAADRNN
jgi:hypothetical protein